MAGGRPRVISSPEEMDQRVDEFIALCAAQELPVTLTGMILHMGLVSRQSLDQYGDRPEFYDSVKRAKLIVECGYEQRLSGNCATGSIFALKNFGWKDKQEIDQTLNANVKQSVEWVVQPVKPANEV